MTSLPLYATEGFVALVHVPVKGGPPQRDAYLIALPTREEVIATLRKIYANEPLAEFKALSMATNEVIGQKMTPGEVRAWT
jgi:hypothetical protein